MKQRITIEQFNELTKEQKQNLRNSWEPKEGDWVAVDSEDGLEEYLLYDDDEYQEYDAEEKVIWGYKLEGEKKLDMCILPLNGQMIELLNKYSLLIEKGRDWTIEIVTGDLPLYKFNKQQKTELCDSLWEAVKVIL